MKIKKQAIALSALLVLGILFSEPAKAAWQTMWNCTFPNFTLFVQATPALRKIRLERHIPTVSTPVYTDVIRGPGGAYWENVYFVKMKNPGQQPTHQLYVGSPADHGGTGTGLRTAEYRFAAEDNFWDPPIVQPGTCEEVFDWSSWGDEPEWGKWPRGNKGWPTGDSK